MKFIFSYLTFLISINVNAQNPKSIAIIHRGDELKPVGTLLISLGVKIMPNERPFVDSLYGRGIKTDAKTFFFLESYFRKNDLLIENAEKLHDGSQFYAIKLSNGDKLFLGVLNFNSFFYNLRSVLKRKHLNPLVIEVLKYY